MSFLRRDTREPRSLSLSMHTRRKGHVSTAKRQLSSSQEDSSHPECNQPEPWSWHPSLQNCEEIISVKPRSVRRCVLTVQADWDILLCSWTSARRHPACPTWGARGIARGSPQVEHHGYAQKPWPCKERWGPKGTDRVWARAAGELWHLVFYGRPALPQRSHHLSRLLSLAPRSHQPCTLPCQGFREPP